MCLSGDMNQYEPTGTFAQEYVPIYIIKPWNINHVKLNNEQQERKEFNSALTVSVYTGISV